MHPYLCDLLTLMTLIPLPVMYGDKAAQPNVTLGSSRKEYPPDYSGQEWSRVRQMWDNPRDRFSVPMGMFRDQDRCRSKPITLVASIFNGYGEVALLRRNPG